MPRRPRCRRVAGPPCCAVFRPAGTSAETVEEVVLHLDELEALRLADAEGLYQEEGARRMGVSRATFGRILGAARHKVARALTAGMTIRVAGGHVDQAGGSDPGQLRCPGCAHRWADSGDRRHLKQCPACGGRAVAEPGPGLEGRDETAPAAAEPRDPATEPNAAATGAKPRSGREQKE